MVQFKLLCQPVLQEGSGLISGALVAGGACSLWGLLLQTCCYALLYSEKRSGL
jgi:hypothetical protein